MKYILVKEVEQWNSNEEIALKCKATIERMLKDSDHTQFVCDDRSIVESTIVDLFNVFSNGNYDRTFMSFDLVNAFVCWILSMRPCDSSLLWNALKLVDILEPFPTIMNAVCDLLTLENSPLTSRCLEVIEHSFGRSREFRIAFLNDLELLEFLERNIQDNTNVTPSLNVVRNILYWCRKEPDLMEFLDSGFVHRMFFYCSKHLETITPTTKPAFSCIREIVMNQSFYLFLQKHGLVNTLLTFMITYRPTRDTSYLISPLYKVLDLVVTIPYEFHPNRITDDERFFTRTAAFCRVSDDKGIIRILNVITVLVPEFLTPFLDSIKILAGRIDSVGFPAARYICSMVTYVLRSSFAEEFVDVKLISYMTSMFDFDDNLIIDEVLSAFVDLIQLSPAFRDTLVDAGISSYVEALTLSHEERLAEAASNLQTLLV